MRTGLFLSIRTREKRDGCETLLVIPAYSRPIQYASEYEMDHNTEEQSFHGVWKSKSVSRVEAEHTPMHLLGIPLPCALNHKTSSSVFGLL